MRLSCLEATRISAAPKKKTPTDPARIIKKGFPGHRVEAGPVLGRQDGFLLSLLGHVIQPLHFGNVKTHKEANYKDGKKEKKKGLKTQW